jgi:hypothetical protein
MSLRGWRELDSYATASHAPLCRRSVNRNYEVAAIDYSDDEALRPAQLPASQPCCCRYPVVILVFLCCFCNVVVIVGMASFVLSIPEVYNAVFVSHFGSPAPQSAPPIPAPAPVPPPPLPAPVGMSLSLRRFRSGSLPRKERLQQLMSLHPGWRRANLTLTIVEEDILIAISDLVSGLDSAHDANQHV